MAKTGFKNKKNFNSYMSVHRQNIVSVQPKNTKFLNSLISVRRATYLRRFIRPSSRAQKLHIQRQLFLRPLLPPHYYHLFLAVVGSNWQIPDPVCVCSFWAPDDGRNNRLKHIERLIGINKLRNVASFWLYSENKKTVFTNKIYLCLRNKVMQQYCGSYIGLMLIFVQFGN